MSMSRKQPKINRYQPSKSVSTTNFFKGLEEKLDDANNNLRVEQISKTPPIPITRINNFSSFSQLLKNVAADKYKIKIMNEQIKIQRAPSYR